MIKKLIHDDDREADLQKILSAIMSISVTDTGDRGTGAKCPFCLSDCAWNDSMEDFKHEPDCVYLIAKDLKRR